jgi:hypothetical protein
MDHRQKDFVAIMQIAIGYKPDTASSSQIKRMAKVAPALVAGYIDKLFHRAAKMWEWGQRNDTSAEADRRCDDLRDRAETVLSLWQIEVDYPGLYPSFKLDGFSYYDVLTVLREAIK